MGLTPVRRIWRWCALGLVALLAGVAVPVAGGEPSAAAQEDVTAPTGRAVCNTAFTAVAVLGFGNFVVPADVPLGPNDIVTALRPVLELCISVYPPRPPTRCEVTASLIPATPIPITPPDVGGILAEQTEALLAALGEPIATALGGPLRDLFVTGLGCGVPETDDATVPEAPTAAAAPPAVGPVASPSDAGRTPSAIVPVDLGGGDDGPGGAVGTPVGGIPVLRSVVAAPLRGAGAVAAAGALLLLGLLLSRQLAPRRAVSLGRPTSRRR